MPNYEENQNPRWWAKSRSVHEEVWTVADRIHNEESTRRSVHKRYQAMYEDAYRGEAKDGQRIVSYNGVRKIIDTMVAEVASEDPRVQAMTVAGDFAQRERAKKLTRFLDGQFSEMKWRRKFQLALRDACTFDGGVLRLYKDKKAGKVRCDRVYPHEILVDSIESFYGEPRQLFLRRAMNRDVLCALYPKKAVFIRDEQPSRMEGMSGVRETGSMVDVIESWHLPSAEGADDGRHVICVRGATLFDEPWTHDWFPFVFIMWQDPLRGFWFEGLTRELSGLQQELNQLYENIRSGHVRGGHFGVYLPTGSNIDEDEMNNEIGMVVKGDQAPQMLQFPVMHPQTYEWSGQLKRDMHEVTGASESAAHGEKPAGVISGAAIREVSDRETGRHLPVRQRIEDAHLEAAEKIIQLSREMFAEGVDVKVKSRDREFLESIKWKDVDMDDDSYSLQLFKTSGLPKRPEAKIDKVIELHEAGIFDKDTVGDLLGTVPDVDAAMEAQLAPRRNINRMLDDMVARKVQHQPLPYMNLELAKQLCVNKLNWCDVENVPEDAKERLLTFLKQVEDLLIPPAPPPALPMPMDPGMPPMPPDVPPGGEPMLPPDMAPEMMQMPPDMPPDMAAE